MNLFSPPDKSLFFSRQDPADPRLGDLVTTTPEDPGVAILGYPDDEGIRLNGGRAGAEKGPDSIRHWLYRMTPHPTQDLKSFFDLGNLKFASDLEQRHNDVAATVEDLLRKDHHVLALGGGNDYAYADGMGFLNSIEDSNGIILNIDAHLDVRNLERGLTSGTPFFRLLESSKKFHFVELGTQSQCNSKAHWDYVLGKGGRIIPMDDILMDHGKSLTETVAHHLADLFQKRRPAFVAIDIDAFAYPYAAGSSAAWPLGILPHGFHGLLQFLLARWDVRVLGIYEVSPPLDSGFATSKLAAQWAHMFLHHPHVRTDSLDV